MARLFEFSDQAWLPRMLRRFLTDLLEFQASTFHLYEEAIPKLNEALRRAGSREILDLCSGSGGPLLRLKPPRRRAGHAQRPFRVAPGRVSPWEPDVAHPRRAPIAQRPAVDHGAARFTSFQIRRTRGALASGPAEARAPIAVFEFTERSFSPGSGGWSTRRSASVRHWRVRSRRASRSSDPRRPVVLPSIVDASRTRRSAACASRALDAGRRHEWRPGSSVVPAARAHHDPIGLPADSP
jgi:hypothetical protein